MHIDDSRAKRATDRADQQAGCGSEVFAYLGFDIVYAVIFNEFGEEHRSKLLEVMIEMWTMVSSGNTMINVHTRTILLFWSKQDASSIPLSLVRIAPLNYSLGSCSSYW